MKATYQRSWLWFLVAILMVPLAYGQETILVANWINGNTNLFTSRVYLWNPSTSAGNMTVTIYSLPRPAPGDAPEASVELGTVDLGSLEPRSGRTLKVERVLAEAQITTPYLENGGNLVFEFTIEAAGVRGSAQVFSNDLITLPVGFGTYPLQVISATGTNTATGNGALQSNSTGSDNSATGFGALQNNTTGTDNTAMGSQALLSNTTGLANTATGRKALEDNTIGSQNVATGYFALANNTTASDNSATGFGALQNNTTGTDNTAMGSQALLSNTTGLSNTATGFGSLRANTTGLANTATGNGALRANSTGSWNTAAGDGALRNNTIGFQNTAVGRNALRANTTGENNIAVGPLALRNNTIGFQNTAVGMNALQDNTIGANNIAMGGNALQNNTSGSSNIALGFDAGINATNGDDNIYVGHGGFAAESNTIRIGNSTDHSSAFIAGVSGVTTPLIGVSVLIDENGQLGTVSSSRRFKKDIRDMGETSSGLMQLRPVKFRYKKEYAKGERPLQFGLIAEEVAPVYPELVQYTATGEAQTVLYHQLPAMLLNELQKQHRQVQELTERLARLEQVLTAQQSFAALTE